MLDRKKNILFIAHNLTSSGGIESVSRMICENQELFGITKIINLNRKVNTGFSRAISRLKMFPQIIQIIFQILFRKYSRILVSHIAIVTFLLLITSQTRILVICHGGEVWRNRKLLKLADNQRIYWIAVSEFTKSTMEEFVKQRVKFTNEIDILHLTSPLISNEIEVKNLKTPYSFLSVSRLEKSSRYKGIDTAITIFSQIIKEYPEAKLVIVGTGNDLEYYLDLVSKYNLQKSVLFKGFISLEELKFEFRQSQFFLLPGRPTISNKISEGEGFGIVFIEASYFNVLPIGGVGDGSSSAIINDVTGLLVDSRNLAKATRMILDLVANQSKVFALKENGIQFVLKNHSRNQFIEDLNKALEKL